ncbi:MAG TPA: hypothetical protein VLA98_06495 [Solirubrobacteraceae bacterium]|nr:hypothetical protein [Solirubrobacteraceae bacterium]
MHDDWRAELDIEEHGGLHRLLESVREHRVAREARHRLGERVLVTVDAARVFGYAETREQAEEAARVLADLAAAQGLTASASVARWHPVAERWEAPDAPLPATPEAERSERGERDAREDAESRAAGVPQWEVRVELASREDTAALAERLEGEGLPVIRRSRFLVVGAADEDAAHALAQRLRDEAPPGARVVAEGAAGTAWDELHPFRVLGGLGG